MELISNHIYGIHSIIINELIEQYKKDPNDNIVYYSLIVGDFALANNHLYYITFAKYNNNTNIHETYNFNMGL